MDKGIAGLLCLVSALAVTGHAQAAPPAGFDPGAVQQVQYYYHHHHHHRHWHHHHRPPVVVIAPR